MIGLLFVFITSLTEGLLLALVTIGFQMIYKGFKFFDMSVGSIYIGSVYFFQFGTFIGEHININNQAYLLLFSYLISILATITCSILTGFGVYNRFIRKKAGEMVLMIVSLAIYTTLLNVFVMFAGDNPQKFYLGEFFENQINIFGSNYLYVHIVQLTVSFVLLASILVFIQKTNLGYKITALSDNKQYFEIIGLSVTKTRLVILIIASVLINTSAILKTAEVSMSPHITGFQYVLLAAVAMIISGNDSYFYSILTSFGLMLLMNLTDWYMPDGIGIWKHAIVFVVLILVLIFRPGGLKSISLRAED